MESGLFSAMFTIVPALIAIAALFTIGSAIRDLVRSSGLSSRGRQATGKVISANVVHSGSSDSRRSRIVETIEFTTDRGETIRANPILSDVGMLDRSGQTVTVLYDDARPERFAAPRNGRSASPAGPLGKIGVGVVMLVFLGFFVTMTQSMMSGFPF